jgi:hypothetical protein
MLDGGCWILVDTAGLLSKSSNKYQASRIQYLVSILQPPKEKGPASLPTLTETEKPLKLKRLVDSGKINPLYMFVLFAFTLDKVIVLR